MKSFAVGVTFFPFSWALGTWKKPHKTLWSLGPFRLVFYRIQGKWKETSVAPALPAEIVE